MAYIEPGVIVRQEFVQTETLQVATTDLPICLVGPLYRVTQGNVTAFSPLSSAPQTFAWPGKMVGTVVDLSGTRNGFIDSQRRDFAPYMPTFQLVDPATGQVVDVPADLVSALTQTGFTVAPGASVGQARVTQNTFVVSLDGDRSAYAPRGGFGPIVVGDLFGFGPDNFVVQSRNATVLASTVALTSETASTTLVTNTIITLAVVPAPIPGRVSVSIAGSDFAAQSALPAINAPVVTYRPLTGFNSSTGQAGANNTITALVPALLYNSGDLVGKRVRVENVSTGALIWSTVVAFNPATSLLTIGESAGTLNTNILVTIYSAQRGYAESVNVLQNEIIVVLDGGQAFSDAEAIVSVYTGAAVAVQYFPPFALRASYRQSRKDLANQVFTASSVVEFLQQVSHTAIHVSDVMGFAFNVADLTQRTSGSARPITFVVVDEEPNSSTGLQENLDRQLGYTEALENIESVEVYKIQPLTDLDSIRIIIQAHITAMSDAAQKQERTTITSVRMPQGRIDGTTGVVEPGRVPGGIVTANTSGNGNLIDANVAFLAQGQVAEGTRVEVTYPALLVGSYVASSSTTDDTLVLNGFQWPVVPEFPFDGASLTVATASSVHTFTGATPGTWVHVEPGDYFRVTAAGVTYSLRVLSVALNGGSLSAIDEVAGSLDLTAASLATDTHIVRSWGGGSNVPFVAYHIAPLTKSQVTDRLIATKPVNNRRVCVMMDYRPTMVVGVNALGQEVSQELDTYLSCVAVAARRSATASHLEITNRFLSGGITTVKHGFGALKNNDLNRLAEAGFTLLTQITRQAPPYIRDMLTSATVNFTQSQEVVTSNADWISKVLRRSLRPAAGAAVRTQRPALTALRAAQIYSIFESFRTNSPEPIVINFSIRSVGINEANPTKTDIVVDLQMPVGDKIADITLAMTT